MDRRGSGHGDWEGGGRAMKRRRWALLGAVCLIAIACAMSCSRSEGAGLAKDQADAYFLVFEDIFELDDELNSDIEFIAIDTNDMKISDTKQLITLLQGFCDSHGFTLLQDDFDGLVDKKYIENQYFKEGILVKFNDSALGQDSLETMASKWRSALGMIGAEYKVEKADGKWEITNTFIRMKS